MQTAIWSWEKLNILFSTRNKTFILRNGRKSYITLLERQYSFRGSHRFSTSSDGSFDENEVICWKCGRPITSRFKFICNHCKIILPPTFLTFFEIFNMDEKFDISTLKLQKDFKDMQRVFHPDKYSLQGAREKDLSAQISSLLNVAYKTLLDPLSRGVYMLKQRGITIDEETQLSNPEFLMEIMELNEQISSSENEENLRKIQDEVVETYNELINEISIAFNSNKLVDAKEYIIKLRYYNNVSEKLKHLIPPS
ncbi:iron-sulfur cluster co-chaperone protein HscB-like isoform X2 [Styela clava]|uniref:iron-sulfur cluster co-chaperone protein HscB-like isoform X2 n=1 Tax=Styela clava TaxID=7725 RepID=UPI00193AB41A|nr:iron-sulfur cluster co-chaperone protein HscB-like isoform X2 [Styela clava]